jgi:hypothetical protein
MPPLVQDGIDRGGGVGGQVGDHDVLRVVVEEEPGLLPAECFGLGVEISHGGGASLACRYAADEGLESVIRDASALEFRGTVFYGGTRDEIPIPGRSDVFVFVSLKVRVEGTVGKVEAKWLMLKSDARPVYGIEERTFCELMHSVFFVRVEYIFNVET